MLLFLRHFVLFNIHISLFPPGVHCARVVIILTCLHKANVLNQAELSQSERRAQRQEWERKHSFQGGKHQSTSSGSGTSMISATKSIPTQNDLRVKRQLLDAALLEEIIEESSV